MKTMVGVVSAQTRGRPFARELFARDWELLGRVKTSRTIGESQ
jgi:hypothetical protein